MTLRALPSVDSLLRFPEIESRRNAFGRELALTAARAELERARAEIRAGAPNPTDAELARRIVRFMEEAAAPAVRRVINATGVILHTNLGRAPLSRAALQALVRAG